MSSLWEPAASIERIPCRSCHSAHRIQTTPKQDGYFYTCTQTNITHVIPAQAHQRWQCNQQRLLRYLCSQLNIAPHITNLVGSDLISLGTVQMKGIAKSIDIWLCRSLSVAAISRLIRQDADQNTVLLTFDELPESIHGSLQVVCLDLCRLESTSGLGLDKAYFFDWLRRQFQRLRFEPSNGDLWLDDTRMGSLIPSSAPYFFVRCLWEHCDQPMSHDDIFAYCCEQLAARDFVEEWYSEYLPSSFCHAMNREIKRVALEPKLVAQVITATKTIKGKNGYRLVSPS